MMRTPVAHSFGPDGILLVLIRELALVGRFDVGVGRRTRVQAPSPAIEENVAEPKGGTAGPGVGSTSGLHVFPWAAEKEKTNESHIAGGGGLGAVHSLGIGVYLLQYRERDWLDAAGLRVGLAVTF
jgi:hypothetical protein